MQRYGPPPAYPNLKVPGVNIPIPASLKFRDSESGGLFKDENGLTVYADCHGLNRAVYESRITKKTHWGEIVVNVESEEEIEEMQEESSEISEEQEGFAS